MFLVNHLRIIIINLGGESPNDKSLSFINGTVDTGKYASGYIFT